MNLVSSNGCRRDITRVKALFPVDQTAQASAADHRLAAWSEQVNSGRAVQ
ncbi:hypothetical protein [Mycolicibacterium sp. XJ1819]